MFAARIAAITAATILTGAAIAAFSTTTFQKETQKVKEHEMITKGAGTWHGTISMIIAGQDEPVVSRCSETVTAIGDFWTVSEFFSEFEGKPFHGSSTMGYDLEKKAFVATWVDSATTHITNMEGQYDGGKSAVVLDYNTKDYMTGEPKNSRMVIHQGQDKYTSHFYDVVDGAETLTMTIEMKRKATVEASADKAAEAVEEAVEEGTEDSESDDQ